MGRPSSSRRSARRPGRCCAGRRTTHYAAYVAAIDEQPDDSLDLVVVDGRERARCAARATAKVRPGGLLLVDDIDRERYHAAVDAIGWPRRDVVGFAPAKPTLAYTAVLTRPAR